MSQGTCLVAGPRVASPPTSQAKQFSHFDARYLKFDFSFFGGTRIYFKRQFNDGYNYREERKIGQENYFARNIQPSRLLPRQSRQIW